MCQGTARWCPGWLRTCQPPPVQSGVQGSDRDAKYQHGSTNLAGAADAAGGCVLWWGARPLPCLRRCLATQHPPACSCLLRPFTNERHRDRLCPSLHLWPISPSPSHCSAALIKETATAVISQHALNAFQQQKGAKAANAAAEEEQEELDKELAAWASSCPAGETDAAAARRREARSGGAVGARALRATAKYRLIPAQPGEGACCPGGCGWGSHIGRQRCGRGAAQWRTVGVRWSCEAQHVVHCRHAQCCCSLSAGLKTEAVPIGGGEAGGLQASCWHSFLRDMH